MIVHPYIPDAVKTSFFGMTIIVIKTRLTLLIEINDKIIAPLLTRLHVLLVGPVSLLTARIQAIYKKGLGRSEVTTIIMERLIRKARELRIPIVMDAVCPFNLTTP